MPAKSPEAIERKRVAANARKQAQRDQVRKSRSGVAKPIVPKSPNRKFFLGPRMRDMSKSELRAMLAEAVRNTSQINL
jgi:hypothetical protein